jgi:hypothetical protein
MTPLVIRLLCVSYPEIMPTFQILLHTSDIHVELDQGPTPCVGFYTSRRASAQTSDEAFQKIMKEFDADPKMQDIFQTAHDHGLRPKTEIEEVYLIPWWEALFPWKSPALFFYPAEDAVNSKGQKQRAKSASQRAARVAAD